MDLYEYQAKELFAAHGVPRQAGLGASTAERARIGAESFGRTVGCMAAAVAVLESEGVDTVFGIPGAAILPLYAALRTSSIRHITVWHEEGGTHAADGWARVTGKVGVCIGTSGLPAPT